MKLSLCFLAALAALFCFAAVDAANPLKIIKISKVVRTGVNKFHDAIGSRHGRSVEDSEVTVDRVARSTAGKWFNRVKDGVKSRVGRALSPRYWSSMPAKNNRSEVRPMRVGRSVGKKIWNAAKCKTVYYLFRPKECAKYDLY
ncbi:hypothetical protein HDE_03588 [Halotydeus destructor]|nr:hypothetical protein HDE_03588 [Halotydeus destructor]